MPKIRIVKNIGIFLCWNIWIDTISRFCIIDILVPAALFLQHWVHSRLRHVTHSETLVSFDPVEFLLWGYGPLQYNLSRRSFTLFIIRVVSSPVHSWCCKTQCACLSQFKHLSATTHDRDIKSWWTIRFTPLLFTVRPYRDQRLCQQANAELCSILCVLALE